MAAARGSAGSAQRRLAGGARAAEEFAQRAPGRPAAHLERSGRTGAGRGAGAQARDPASPLPTSPAGAHLGDSQRKRSLGGAASLGNAGGPAGRQEAAAEEELSRAATGATATRVAGAATATCTWLLAPPRAEPPAGRRFPPPALPTCPGKPASRRVGSRGPSEGQLAGTAPELPAAGWTRSRERVSVAPPPRERPAGIPITPVAGASR